MGLALLFIQTAKRDVRKYTATAKSKDMNAATIQQVLFKRRQILIRVK